MEAHELFESVRRVVEAEGLELVEAQLARRGRRQVLVVVIYAERGVTLGDCAQVTRSVGAAVEARGLVTGSYVLEVTSPGIDRVLKSPREFEVFRGKPVRLWIEKPAPREILGTCAGIQEGGRVAFRSAEGDESVVAWDEIVRARLEPAVPARSEGRGT